MDGVKGACNPSPEVQKKLVMARLVLRLDGACIVVCPGDCTLTQDGAKYNLCVKAHRRTVFTNHDRVFTMQFLVRAPLP